MEKSEKEKIRDRIKELNIRMEELEEINQNLLSDGKEEEFDLRYGIEYENISDELYRQMMLLQQVEKLMKPDNSNDE